MRDHPPTVPEIRDALQRLRIRTRKRYGQHFIADQGLLQGIVDAASPAEGDLVLEVGPGAGTLTTELLNRGARVVAVEVDTGMADLLGELIGAPPNLEIVLGDALEEARDFQNSKMGIALREGSSEREGYCYALVANLPYQIAGSLLVELFYSHPPRHAVVTVQREVGDRITAAPGDSAYGPLGLLLQLRCKVHTVRTISAASFWPAPKVDATCLRLEPHADGGAARDIDGAWLRKIAHGVFWSRRKKVGNSLSLALDGLVDHAAIKDALSLVEIDPARRGESLDTGEVARLARALLASVEL